MYNNVENPLLGCTLNNVSPACPGNIMTRALLHTIVIAAIFLHHTRSVTFMKDHLNPFRDFRALRC